MQHINIKFIKKFWDKLEEQQRENWHIYNDCPKAIFVKRIVSKINFARYYRFIINGKMHIGTMPYYLEFAYNRRDEIRLRYFSVIENDVVDMTLWHNDTLRISYEEISEEQILGIKNTCSGTIQERFDNEYSLTHQSYSDFMDEINAHIVTQTIYKRLAETLTYHKLQGIADIIKSTNIFKEDGTINNSYTEGKGKPRGQKIYTLPNNMPTGNAWHYLNEVRQCLVKFGFIKETEKQYLKKAV